MTATLLAAGLACIIAALAGGGLKAFSIELPLLQSMKRQVLLGILGVALTGFAVARDMSEGVKPPAESTAGPPAPTGPAATPETKLPTAATRSTAATSTGSVAVRQRNPSAPPATDIVEPGITESEANQRGDAAYARRDYSEAMKWWRHAAALGNKFALANVGILYVNGQGVPQSDDLAIEWFRKAAAIGEGHAGAERNIASLYERGYNGVPNLTKAREWYKRAADKGEPGAQAWLQAHPE